MRRLQGMQTASIRERKKTASRELGSQQSREAGIAGARGGTRIRAHAVVLVVSRRDAASRISAPSQALLRRPMEKSSSARPDEIARRRARGEGLEANDRRIHLPALRADRVLRIYRLLTP